ncbi:NADH dehydrogenase [Heterostelium album PN500]|uniref:NADH dehydrogenase n=1 Tax=Heterostelium pallidum (strain ATCC 26659 / Pp 5 / PN500) TaxID=670386 RepID=D3BQF3_HETP5|nr:NADH dehydrogenase [Heterostelium album PN500]EFA76373.1 NADH dehydrogenase [Heterostelium album PN500]|eukprot:XP_020428505.1 NADH dehydrogenase [Heterostelium album PN500]
MSQFIKKSTGITGLAVQPHARRILADLYQKTLKELQRIPPTAFYRQKMEEITKFRYDVIQKETDILKIEQTIFAGQVEELITQAENELQVIDLVAKTKAYELSDKNKPPMMRHQSIKANHHKPSKNNKNG